MNNLFRTENPRSISDEQGLAGGSTRYWVKIA
jgi:hypothetical protein